MLDLSRDQGCISEPGPSGRPFTCKSCPDYDCPKNMGNGLFMIYVSLQSTPDNPPSVSRLYCKKGKLGRFKIKLTDKIRDSSYVLYGTVNVLYGDIIEWNHNNVRNIGLVDERGSLIKLEMFHSCIHFHKLLKKYLTTRNMQYIKRYISGKSLNFRVNTENRVKPFARVTGIGSSGTNLSRETGASPGFYKNNLEQS